MKTFYITTPIYYVNDVPHIGHAYSTVGADALARFKRMDGYDVFFLTGNDVHGQKIARTAQEMGLTPEALVDKVVVRFVDAWKKLGISNDDFILTSHPHHKEGVTAFFRKAQAAGYIYKGDYEGWYCLPDEKFLQDSEVIDGKCPDCGRDTERIKESNYFLKMSAFQKALEEHLEKHPGFVQPDSRKAELVNNFIKPGLSDVSITRNTVTWGIPAPVPEKTVIYVWIDALLNYITALGWPDGEKYRKFWLGEGCESHETVHLIGKDILRFHATIWPSMLWAVGAPQPTRIFGTGHINKDGKKMSKSLGNVVDPFELADKYGPDAVRYYLLREFPLGQDGNYSDDSFIRRFNGDLANDLGNLVNRTLVMFEKYFDGHVPLPTTVIELPVDSELRGACPKLYYWRNVISDGNWGNSGFRIDLVLEDIWRLVKRANKYIEDCAPWQLFKKNEKDRLICVMLNLFESIKITAISIAPYMPFAAQAIWGQLGYVDSVHEHKFSEIWDKENPDGKWGPNPVNQRINRGAPLFPRIEVVEEVEITDDDFIGGVKDQLKHKVFMFIKNKGIKLKKYGWIEVGEEFVSLRKENVQGFFVKSENSPRKVLKIPNEKLLQMKSSQNVIDEVFKEIVNIIELSLAN